VLRKGFLTNNRIAKAASNRQPVALMQVKTSGGWQVAGYKLGAFEGTSWVGQEIP